MDGIKFIIENYGILTNLEISQKLNISIGKVRSLVYKHIPFESRYRRGKSPHSRPKRKYNLIDTSFSTYNTESCYWAGLMAADGHIKKQGNSFSIGLKESDKNHLEKFKKWLKFEGSLLLMKNTYSYKDKENIKYAYSIQATSHEIVDDLDKNFGIVNNKSLTIKPPLRIVQPELIDCFIKGYIDGDGSVMTDSDKTSRLCVIGTYEMMCWMNERFENIVGRKLPKPTKKHNIWRIDFRNKISRKILRHFFDLNCPYLERKWTDEIRQIVFNYEKSRNLTRYNMIYEMKKTGMNQTQIAKELNVSPAAISWIVKQKQYKNIEQS